MRIVARSSMGGAAQQMAAVVPIQRAQGGLNVAGLLQEMAAMKAKIGDLEGKLMKTVQAHNATVDELMKLKASHNTLARGASSLAKHFQGFVAAAQIQYTPAVVARAAPPAAQPARQATQAQPMSGPPPSAAQQVVEAEPAETNDPWAQRNAAFFEGGEGPEG